MLIVYENGDEVLVCSGIAGEKELLRDYFTLGGRIVEEYDRTVYDGVVQVQMSAKVSGSRIVKANKGG